MWSEDLNFANLARHAAARQLAERADRAVCFARRLFFSSLWIALVTGCGPDASAPSGPPPVSVEVARVEVGAVTETAELVGELFAMGTVLIQPEIDGSVKTLDFQEGQYVKAGTPLYHLDDAEQRAKLHSAQATLALKEAAYQRTKALAAHEASSAANLDRASAELKVAKADVEFAQLQLDRTVIRAPWSGMVGLSSVYPGQRVEVKTQLVRLDNLARVQVVASVPEQALPRVQMDAPMQFRVAAYADEVFTGTVFFISPTLDAQTRRLTVKARVENPDGRLRPGMFANIRAELGTNDQALLVRESAVVYDRTGTFVWKVAKDGEKTTAEKALVTIGARQGDRVEITSGLAAGDLVVSAGTNKVFVGAVLLVQEKASQTSVSPTMPSAAAKTEGGA